MALVICCEDTRGDPLKFDEVVHGSDFKPSEAPAEPDESEVPEPVEVTAVSAPAATVDQKFKEFKL